MKNLVFIIALFFTMQLSTAQTKAIEITTEGKGNPVLFLPGFTNPGTIWKATFEQLKTSKKAHFVSYAGFNGLKPIEMPWYATIKKELIAYIKHKDLKNIEIVGHSMGGTLAADIAAEIPERIQKIVLVDALPCMREVMMPGVPAESLQHKSPYNDQMLAMNDKEFASMAGMMAAGMTDNQQKVETVKNWILEADRKTYVYGYTDLLKLDVRPQLAKIHVPVLILGAPAYGDISKQNMEKQYANLSNKTLKMAPKGKHFIMFDNEEWFYQQLNSFLDSEQ
jgi:pimeloyl-ACP methyl ester carboxylesterase